MFDKSDKIPDQKRYEYLGRMREIASYISRVASNREFLDQLVSTFEGRNSQNLNAEQKELLDELMEKVPNPRTNKKDVDEILHILRSPKLEADVKEQNEESPAAGYPKS